MRHPGIVMKGLVVLEWTVLDVKFAGVVEVLLLAKCLGLDILVTCLRRIIIL
jgi:hypothetical protein